MTEATNTQNVEETDAPVASASPETEDQFSDPTPDSDLKGNREAAKYRTRLRAAEAERDSVREQLSYARNQILDEALDERFRSVLKLSGRDIGDLFTEGGAIDVESLEKVGAELAEKYPRMIDQKNGEWHALGEEPGLQLLKNGRKGAAAPFDADEGRSPSKPLQGNEWKDAFTPKE